VPKLNRVVANRTKNVYMQIYAFDVKFPIKFPHKSLRTFADYVLASCPVLEKLSVQYSVEFYYSVEFQFERFVQEIMSLNEQLKTGTLEDLETGGCELMIIVQAEFPRQTLTDAIGSGHEVTKIGEPCDKKWMDERQAVIARQVKIKESVFVRYRFMGV